jgi:hypothetical protein
MAAIMAWRNENIINGGINRRVMSNNEMKNI